MAAPMTHSGPSIFIPRGAPHAGHGNLRIKENRDMALRAIAAMSLNRVIGKEGKLPWHIPEDFKWFKKATSGQAVLMGRKTYESLGRALPDRRNLVVSRGSDLAGVEMVRDLEGFRPKDYPCDVWVIGGAEIYRQMLGRCEELYLSVIPRVFEGDTFFPEFEDRFELVGTVLKQREFEVREYRRKG
jgi:dihydrofolate reductase